MARSSDAVMVLCAHPDDHIIGAGGTIAKYSSEGRRVINVVCSYGESSHLWLKKRIIRNIRKQEAIRASRIVGVKRDIFLGLKEGRFYEGLKEQRGRIEGIIKRAKVSKLFTHSPEDPHPDHSALARFSLELAQVFPEMEVLAFNVWNPFTFSRSKAPRLFVDITKHFTKKMAALKAFSSQRVVIWIMIWGVVIGGLLKGLKCKGLFAEEFVKLK